MDLISVSQAYDCLLADDSIAFWYHPEFAACSMVAGPEKVRPNSNDAELALIPGSFNPIHASHRWIFERSPTARTAYEMSITRIDKDPLTFSDLSDRLLQFHGDDNTGREMVLLTNAPRMVHKLALLRGYTVVVHCGADTILRMAKDYGVIGIGGLAGNFIVYDRVLDGNHLRFPPKDWKKKPSNVHRAWAQLPEGLIGLSSSAIRASWAKKQKEASELAIKKAISMMKENEKNVSVSNRSE